MFRAQEFLNGFKQETEAILSNPILLQQKQMDIQIKDKEAEEEGEEVEEHTLADGTDVLKGADGTIYDPESYEPIGKWNKADNTLVEA